ncbi:SusD/RagB family nutrient-binding outer membrane lipoprotein [Myroides odoratimimus]|uniref:SusD/RagB family nutrient-binding outer membrane lipoprotein n=1 Tax=Myroides odoratimimus TaxID=76832 RepID=UPI00046A3C2A|nr:SusD/RagB family nutrient-binding outer membrane lipoprotein [Myroides odoratimimus]MCA4807499.1 SusD/RagB family nutrient-binding outer membrane lipoprotein [Myroides odoratimimus]
MKKYIKIAALVLVIISMGSCQDLDKLSEDPNRVKEADPYLLLPKVSKSAFALNGISKEYASRMIIQTDGENTSQYFKWNSSSFSAYQELLQVQKMMDEAKRTNKEEYIAVGHFLKARFFYELAITFGDVPYSEALLGEKKVPFPKYDKQEDVFVGVLKELELAASMIQNKPSIKGDIIYGGNTDKWKKLINSYQLKVLMSLSKKKTVGTIQVAEQFAKIYNAGNLLESNADSGQLMYFDQAGSRYPQFNSSSYGSSMYMSGTFINLLQDLKDPRLFAFAQQTSTALEKGLPITDFSGYNGGDPTVPYAENEKLVQTKNISKIKSRYYLDPTNEPTSILSYSELQFILAEAVARNWIGGSAADFYNKAIEANFNFYNTYAKGMASYYTKEAFINYINQPKVKYQTGSLNVQLKQILTQKYITMFHQSNWTIYYDHLRTGYPEFKIQEGITPPTRWIYPQTEYNRNQAKLQEALNSQFGGADNIRGITWWLK